MRARNKLNVRQVAGLRQPGVYSDGGGLYLRVRSTGSRSWLYIYSMDGKRREMGLGSDLDVTLAKARDMAAAARTLMLDGVDPQLDRSKTKVAVQPAITFGAFAMELLDDVEAGFKNAKHRQQWRNTLTTYAAPLWPVPIPDITTTAIVEVLKPIWLTKAETASRVRGRIERIMNAATIKGLWHGDNPARGRGHIDEVLPKRTKGKVRHHPALPFKQIPDFMPLLRSRPAVAARALEFAILTAARSGEVRGMTWGEVDLSTSLWTVPVERMKAGEAHEVPLSGAAAAILEALMPEHAPPDAIVFAAPRGGQMSDMALSQLLKRMGRGDITVHGFRSTFRDWAGDTTPFGREEVEMSLAHTIGNKTERAYRRERALQKRCELMAMWALFCGAKPTPRIGASPPIPAEE